MEQENLVQILPKKGILVASLSIGDINAAYEVRLLVEPYAIQNYAKNIEKEWFENYKKILLEKEKEVREERDNRHELYEIDDQFHMHFIKVMKNNYFVELYEQIYNQNLRLRILAASKGKKRMLNTQTEHLEVVELCLKEEWEAAANKMREHLIFSKKASFEAIFQNGDMLL